MPVTAICPSCSKRFHLKDSLAGKRVRCSECDTIIQVGNLDSKESIPAGVVQAPLLRRKSGEATSSQREPAREVPRKRIVENRASTNSTARTDRRPTKKKASAKGNQSLHLVIALSVGAVAVTGLAGFFLFRPNATVSQPVVTTTAQETTVGANPVTPAAIPVTTVTSVFPTETKTAPSIAASDPKEVEASMESAAVDTKPEMPAPVAAEEAVAVRSAAMPTERTHSSKSVVERGKPAPDFELELLDGEPFRLSEQKGKVIILDFWATWCGPCRKGLPSVDRLAKEYKSKGVELYAVNVGEKPEEIKATLKQLNLRIKVALDRDSKISGQYLVETIPRTVVIDREGNVLAVFSGTSPNIVRGLREAVKFASSQRVK